MPVRSTGCATCRKRKIRCDEVRPSCRRCIVHGVPCPGYRTAEPGGLEFRDVTEQVTQKITRTQRPVSTSTTLIEHGNHQATDSTWSNISGESNLVVLRSPSPFQIALRLLQNEHTRSGSESSTTTPTSASSSGSDSPGKTSPEPLFSTLPSWFDRLFPEIIQQTSHPTSHSVNDAVVLNTTQIYSAFLNSWLPEDDAYTDHAFLWGHLLTSAGGHSTLKHSLKAISCIAVGDKFNDDQLLREGMIAYGSALKSLAYNIARKDSYPEDELLASVTVLATCEFYAPLAREGAGWLNHVRGATQLITSRGPDTLKSALSLMVYSNARHANLAQSLISRQSCYMAQPEWRAVAFRCPVIDASTYFYDLALTVPGLLQQHDTIMHKRSQALEDVESLLQDCIAINVELSDWFEHWIPPGSRGEGDVILDIEPIEKFQSFSRLVSDRTIDTGFRFRTYPSGYLAAAYWCTMHLLRSAMQNLYRMYRALNPTGIHSDESFVPAEEELAQYALNLAQCIPYYCEPSTATMGHVGIFLPMFVMAQQFRKTRDIPKLLWLQAVQGVVFDRGIVPPKIPDRKGHMVPAG